ncbi:uncharacterized protein ATNIH1004_001939 [Aspergillus tanneri]|uniref:RTA1 domain protein n=1 Tax=Aspergillus tanneri TaxID=1220188 RepID=A0A5M9M805_9EURO|nr:uncharacterized protein ATNIH1004_001939 [Aspergillus tanneri]KAA8641474.1 hypothetical protein ATNIH1004_001939 [Aspergillus tanneri]
MAQENVVPGSLYIYAPNKWAPIIFTFGFTISGLFHLWQCHRYKCFKLMWLHIACCIMFTIGFATREYGAFNYMDSDANLAVYIVSTCMIYMAPPILELANYHILGHVLYYIPYHSPMHPGRVFTTFGMLSTIVEVMNALGVSNLANHKLPESRRKTGEILMKASLIVQVGVLLLFCVLAAIFQRRCVRDGIWTRRVSVPLWTLYISTFLILIRCVYRIVEHFGFSSLGPESLKDGEEISYILRYEWFSMF